MIRKKIRKEVFNEIVQSYEGSKVSSLEVENPSPQHPFQVTHGFVDPEKFSGNKIQFSPSNPEKNKVFIKINTGFCNADECKGLVRYKYLSDEAKAFIKEDKKQKNKTENEIVEIGLSYRPIFIIGDGDWRPIGEASFPDGSLPDEINKALGINTEKVPEAFLALGVTPARGQNSTYVDEGRKLFAMSIALHCDRWYTEAEVRVANPFVEATTAVFSLMPKIPPNGQLGKGKIRIVTEKFKPSSSVRSLAEVLLGVNLEAWDRLLICEIYAVSPPIDAGAELYTTYPSPSYRIFKKQSLSWNVRYLVPELPKARSIQPITMSTGLLNGIADQIFNSLLTIVNDTTQLVMNILGQLEKRKGKFLTI
jgi:hypothetical protein